MFLVFVYVIYLLNCYVNLFIYSITSNLCFFFFLSKILYYVILFFFIKISMLCPWPHTCSYLITKTFILTKENFDQLFYLSLNVKLKISDCFCQVCVLFIARILKIKVTNFEILHTQKFVFHATAWLHHFYSQF